MNKEQPPIAIPLPEGGNSWEKIMSDDFQVPNNVPINTELTQTNKPQEDKPERLFTLEEMLALWDQVANGSCGKSYYFKITFGIDIKNNQL